MNASGLTVRYQGMICGPAFEISRSLGLEPGFGYVSLHAADYKRLTLEEHSPTADRIGWADKDQAPKEGFSSLGELEVVERIGDAVVGRDYRTVFRHVLVADSAIEAAFDDDDSDAGLVRVAITDIRYLWATRGVVFAWVNVPMNASGQPLTGTTTQERRATQERIVPGSTGATGGTNAQASPMTLRAVLEQIVLPALPGRPKLRRLPPSMERVYPKGHVWDGVLAKQALADLLDEFQLVLALNPDASVSLWLDGEGNDWLDLEGGGNVHDTDAEVVSRRSLLTLGYRPCAVVVIGAPVRETVRLFELEPVGEINGDVRPLREALKSIGLEWDFARKFALLTEAERSVYFEADAKTGTEFDRWAFKWFRLPGGPARNADKLPIEDRGEVDQFGKLKPPLVWSRSFSVVNMAQLTQMLQARDGTRAAAALQAAQKAEVEHMLPAYNHLFGQQSGGYTIDRERGIVMFHQPQGYINEGKPLNEQQAIEPTQPIWFEFGFDHKPGLQDQLSIRNRYHAVFGPPGDGRQGEALVQLDALPEGWAVQPVHRPDLQLCIAFGGSSNKAALDAEARKVAERILRRPKVAGGGILTLHKPLPVLNTGKVKTVAWSTDGERPRVVAHLGAYSPSAWISAGTRLEPRKGGPAEPVTLESPIVPRGIGR